jgi:hypothetical protein
VECLSPYDFKSRMQHSFGTNLSGMYSYVYVYIFVYIYMYVYIYIYTYIYIYIHNAHAYTYVYIFLQKYLCLFINVYIHVYIGEELASLVNRYSHPKMTENVDCVRFLYEFFRLRSDNNARLAGYQFYISHRRKEVYIYLYLLIRIYI